jgi:hypothetical protein
LSGKVAPKDQIKTRKICREAGHIAQIEGLIGAAKQWRQSFSQVWVDLSFQISAGLYVKRSRSQARLADLKTK